MTTWSKRVGEKRTQWGGDGIRRRTPSAVSENAGWYPALPSCPGFPLMLNGARFWTLPEWNRCVNRCMLALAYDAALRREELCLLRSDDVDPAFRTLRVRAETTKSRRERIVPYSAASGQLLRAYLQERRALSQARGP